MDPHRRTRGNKFTTKHLSHKALMFASVPWPRVMTTTGRANQTGLLTIDGRRYRPGKSINGVFGDPDTYDQRVCFCSPG